MVAFGGCSVHKAEIFISPSWVDYVCIVWNLEEHTVLSVSGENELFGYAFVRVVVDFDESGGENGDSVQFFDVGD